MASAWNASAAREFALYDGWIAVDGTCRRPVRAEPIEPTLFLGGHTGFMEDPAKFADRLREVIG
ncbi:hypothetical protein [Nocardia thraciensis]